MSPTAIIMMVIALLIVWGGLVAAIVNIRLRPEVDASQLPPEPEELAAADYERGRSAPLQRDT